MASAARGSRVEARRGVEHSRARAPSATALELQPRNRLGVLHATALELGASGQELDEPTLALAVVQRWRAVA